MIVSAISSLLLLLLLVVLLVLMLVASVFACAIYGLVHTTILGKHFSDVQGLG